MLLERSKVYCFSNDRNEIDYALYWMNHFLTLGIQR